MSRVLVAGRIDMDAVINVDRHPKSGEELGGRDLRYLPGGKGANQAVAAARAGADTVLFGCVGNDSFGKDMLSFLKDERIDTINVSIPADFQTALAFIVVDNEGQNTIVYDATQVPPFTFDNPESITAGDILVSQFDIPTGEILRFLRAGRQRGATNIFNAAPAQPICAELLALIDVLVLNEFELAHALGAGELNPASRVEIEAAMGSFKRSAGQVLIVTLGRHGVCILTDQESTWIEALDVDPVDTTGAGDAFTGALAAELCGGASINEAARYASASAGMSVTRRGAGVAMPYRHEVLSPHVARQPGGFS